MPSPWDKDILLHSITKGPRDLQIPKDYHNHPAFWVAKFEKLYKTLTINLIVMHIHAQ